MLLLSLASAADWVADVDRVQQGRDLDALTGITPVNGATLRSRNLHHPDRVLAQEWLWARLHQLPRLELVREPFIADGVDAVNFIARLNGTDPSLDPVVVSAHYDSTAALGEDFIPMTTAAPGADDDASGCAAVLEIARLLSAEPGFERSIEFVFFDAEEEGLLGSLHHVANRERGVHAMASLDPVGVNIGDWFFMAIGPDATHAEDAWADAAAALPLTTVQRFDTVPAELIGPARSDHGPFMEAGFPAVHLGTFPPPVTYHTSEDTRDLIDPDFLADATSISAAAIAALAQPAQPTSAGCRSVPTGLLGGLYAWALIRRFRGSGPLRRGT